MFVFVEFNGGRAKAVAMTPVVLLSCFVLFAVFFSLLPYFSLRAGLLPVSSSSSSCCFVRAAIICSSSARVVLLAAFLIFLHHILQNSCPLFRLFRYYFLIFLVWLVCCVLVPGTLAFHLLYLD